MNELWSYWTRPLCRGEDAANRWQLAWTRTSPPKGGCIVVGMTEDDKFVGDETQRLRDVLTLEHPSVFQIYVFLVYGKFMSANGVRAVASSSSWRSIWRWHALQVDPSSAASAIHVTIRPLRTLAAPLAGVMVVNTPRTHLALLARKQNGGCSPSNLFLVRCAHFTRLCGPAAFVARPLGLICQIFLRPCVLLHSTAKHVPDFRCFKSSTHKQASTARA